MRRFLFVLLSCMLGVIVYAAGNHTDLTLHQAVSIPAHPQTMRTRYDIKIDLPSADPGKTYVPSCIRPPQILH